MTVETVTVSKSKLDALADLKHQRELEKKLEMRDRNRDIKPAKSRGQ